MLNSVWGFVSVSVEQLLGNVILSESSFDSREENCDTSTERSDFRIWTTKFPDLKLRTTGSDVKLWANESAVRIWSSTAPSS